MYAVDVANTTFSNCFELGHGVLHGKQTSRVVRTMQRSSMVIGNIGTQPIKLAVWK